MRAMLLSKIASLDEDPEPLRLAEVDVPSPRRGEVLIRVSTCGVCHTELDEIEGRTPPPRLPVIPGHQVVGTVERRGEHATDFEIGDRVGVGWIFRSTGEADENLSDRFRATGRDADGGYADYMVIGQRYAYPIPAVFSDTEAAPLLCAGSVGYRALSLTRLVDGQALGLTGFGGSAHLVLQLARHRFPSSPLYVFARSPAEREFALELGAHWSGDTTDRPPEPPDAIIDTTPAWRPVLAALTVLKPGGRLVINAIRKEAGDQEVMAGIDYSRHLWMEKELKTVANVTAHDIAEFLEAAAELPLVPHVTCYPLESANDALRALKAGDVRGSFVLKVN